MKTKIVVTGGTGYIGSHTVVALQNQGYEVVIIDNLSNSKENTIDHIEKITGERPLFEEIDLCDKNALAEVFKRHQNIAAVIHFAAHKAVGESVSNPLKYYQNNVVGLIHLLALMNDYHIENLVFSSSCTVYGQPNQLPVSEKAAIQKASSPYGYTKQMAEQIIADTLHANTIKRAIALRYFNPIGAHPSGLIGEIPNGIPSNLIPFVTQTAIGKRASLAIFGDDYNTPDGTCIRDFIDVMDLAIAHVVAVKRLLEQKALQAYEIFNLGTGNGVSVLEVINTFEAVTGQKVNYKIATRREGDIEKIWADARLANEVLGWKAKKTLQASLLSAWQWEQNLIQGSVSS